MEIGEGRPTIGLIYHYDGVGFADACRDQGVRGHRSHRAFFAAMRSFFQTSDRETGVIVLTGGVPFWR
jgi:hypothetical protein